MVYHHLSFGNISHFICGDSIGDESSTITSRLDAYQTIFCGFVVVIPPQVPSDISATPTKYHKIQL